MNDWSNISWSRCQFLRSPILVFAEADATLLLHYVNKDCRNVKSYIQGWRGNVVCSHFDMCSLDNGALFLRPTSRGFNRHSIGLRAFILCRLEPMLEFTRSCEQHSCSEWRPNIAAHLECTITSVGPDRMIGIPAVPVMSTMRKNGLGYMHTLDTCIPWIYAYAVYPAHGRRLLYEIISKWGLSKKIYRKNVYNYIPFRISAITNTFFGPNRRE